MNEHAPVILVIDDEVQIRRFLRAGFELEGFAVREAADAAAGLRAATLQPLDLVILDLALPDRSECFFHIDVFEDLTYA